MYCHYVEQACTATFVKIQFDQPCQKLWFRHIAGTTTVEVSIGGDIETTHVKVDPAESVHPLEVYMELNSGIRVVAVRGNGNTIAVRAWS